jgi:peroxiredoxin
MSTTVKCPECNSPLELPDAIPTGKRLQCPDCGSAFSPPGEADRAAGLKTEPMRPEGRVPAGSGAATSRRRPSHREEDFGEDTPPRRSGGGSTVLIAAVVVIVLLALGVGGTFLLFVGRAVEMRDEQAEMMAANVGPPPGAMMGPGGGGMMMGGPVAMPPGAGGMAGPGMGLKVGDAAPEIVGEDIHGKPMKLSDFQGKVVVLDFWGDWCPFCKPAYTYQNHLINRMKGEPFVLLGVNCDQTREQAQLVVKTQKIGWRSWYDGGGQMMGGPIFSNYGITAVPTTFIIDKKGIIQQRLDQAPGEFQFDQEVDRVMALSENRPANAPTRWFPGSTAFSQLGDEVAIGAYLMRPPADYVLEKLPPEAKRETYRWKGPPRKDGSVPVIEVSLAAAPPADKKLEELLETDLQSIPRAGLLGWNCPGAERGDVKGITFTRARWTVTAGPNRIRAIGYQYVAVDGDTLVRIATRDSIPAFGAQDAAPLTFRRAPEK